MSSTYRIVVGVDGSEGGDRALRWAMHEAERNNGTVQAVTAWSWDGIERSVVVAPTPAEERQHAEQVLSEAVTAALTTYPAVTVAGEAVEGRSATVLAAAARGADLLVLGSHGHSRLRHAVLGSVAEECIRLATCPVVIVPVPQPPPAHSEDLVERGEQRGRTASVS
ncbi:MAG TPA: universal stress protein [Micromonosporaceae bacterium]